MSPGDRVLAWLLEAEQPSVRYLALTDLLGKAEGDADVRAAKAAVAGSGWAKDILDRQKARGQWEDEGNLYRPKYTSTNWMLLVLADLGLTRADPRIDRACRLWIDRFAS